MISKLHETNPNENLIHRFMGWCDRGFHWIIGLMLLLLFAGIFMYGSGIGMLLLGIAITLFFLVLVPFILIKLFTPGKIEPPKV